jgi:hypothetical protein
MKRLSVFFLVFISTLPMWSAAQRFGGNSPSIKWRQIQSRAGNLIFSQRGEELAKRVTTVINNLAWVTNGSLGEELKPINIVLQEQPLVTNGYVGLAPWRSEFYLTPFQNSLYFGTTKWIDNLAVHEYRHVHQYANFRKGISKFAYLIAGQEGQALANAAAVPDWFFEGDAVYSETKFLSHGRGRMPYFFDPYHSLWLANKKYSYQKLRNGSMRDFVPDHYALGYLLVQYGYKEYGDDFWGKVTNDAVRFKGLVYPFQQAVKKHSGIRFSDFVSKAIDSYKLNMNNEVAKNERLINKVDQKKVVDYEYPLWIGQDSILVLRTAFDEIAKWVLLQKNTMTKLATKDIGLDDYFTYKNGKIVYTAYHPDVRWQWREYNDIVVFDIKTGVRNWITKNSRYFSPDLSHDGTMIAAVEVDGAGRSFIDLIDVENKKKLKSFESNSTYFFSYPVFSDDDKKLFAIAIDSSAQSSIVCFDIATGEFTKLTSSVSSPMAFLRVFNKQLIFSVTHDQRNELWKFDLENKRFNILSSAATGSYAGGLDEKGEHVVYTKPTAEGKQIFLRTIQDGKSIDTIGEAGLVYPTSFSKEDHKQVINQHIEVAPSIPYRKSTSIINIHSWRPLYEQPEWSFTLYGQNVLNTLQTDIKYTFNENERSQKVGMKTVFGGYFPWVSVGTDYTFSRKFSDSLRSLKWNEWNGNIGLRLPLNFSSGKFFRNLDLSTNLYGVSLNYDQLSKPSTSNKAFGYVQEQLTWSMQLQKSVQQIFPHFAFSMKLQNRHAIGSTNARQFYASSQLYLPGLQRTHSIVLGFAYQGRDTLGQYIFSNGFGMPRGYVGVNYPRMKRFAMNYHLPLFYPDWGFANIVYFKRIRTNLFYDMGWFKSLRTGKTIFLRSTGVEMYFDTRWWNQQPVSFGIRYSRLLDTNKFLVKPSSNRWEFVLPLNLIPG